MHRAKQKFQFKPETVRVLSAPELGAVVGGKHRPKRRATTAITCPDHDPPTTAPFCGGGGGDPPTTAPGCGGGGGGGGGCGGGPATTAIFCD